MSNLEFSEDDVWLLESAAQNLRGGGQNEESRVEAAFRIAYKLDELKARMLEAAGKPTGVRVPEVRLSDIPKSD